MWGRRTIGRNPAGQMVLQQRDERLRELSDRLHVIYPAISKERYVPDKLMTMCYIRISEV